VADVGRITELWRAAADALENPRDPLHGWEAAAIENARLLAECGRLREQLDAARQALEQIAHGNPPDDVWDFNVASSGVEWAGKIARAALGVEGE
jgi:hypothetical protein